jgi:hypothetical protein
LFFRHEAQALLALARFAGGRFVDLSAASDGDAAGVFGGSSRGRFIVYAINEGV